MRFDFYYDCMFQAEDAISWTDWINVVIATLNLFIVIYIIRHQRKKDKDDRDFQIKTKSQEYKHNWFKELLILPNIGVVNQHFVKLEEVTKKLKENGLSQRQRSNIDKKLKSEFKKFSKEFIELLYAANEDLANRIQDFSDECLDNLQKEVYSPTRSLSDEDNYQKLILDHVNIYKNKILIDIFNFEAE